MVYTLRFFFPLQNAVCFIILKYLVSVLFTFYIQRVLKLKTNSGAKRLIAVKRSLRTYRYALYKPSGLACAQLYLLHYTDSSGLCLCLNAADIWRFTITSPVANKVVYSNRTYSTSTFYSNIKEGFRSKLRHYIAKSSAQIELVPGP